MQPHAMIGSGPCHIAHPGFHHSASCRHGLNSLRPDQACYANAAQSRRAAVITGQSRRDGGAFPRSIPEPGLLPGTKQLFWPPFRTPVWPQGVALISRRSLGLDKHVCRCSAVDYRSKDRKDVRVLVVGATGYIGKFVVKELIRRGYDVVAFARSKSGIGGKAKEEDTVKEFDGADVRFGDVGDEASLKSIAFKNRVDVVVSCLASRTGGKKDSWAVDYQATLNVLSASRAAGAQHFVLLSAICVQKPLLEFQHAKLKFEAALQAAGDITYSIVRPTAFFKSLAGQVKLVTGGKPYVMFGDGRLASCKPISEADLAAFMADCIANRELANRILPIGGPGRAWSAREQGEFLFRAAGRKEKFIQVPVALMDGIIAFLDLLARIFPGLEDAAEFGRIGRYYATESMLLYDAERQRYDADATPSYGTDTLEAFFTRAVREGGLVGQELGNAAVF